MIMTKRLLSAFLLFCPSLLSSSQTLDIGLSYEKIVGAIILTAEKGDYILFAGGNDSMAVARGNNIYIRRHGDSLYVKSAGWPGKITGQAFFKRRSAEGYFSLRPVIPRLPVSLYDDDLMVFCGSGGLVLVNRIGMEKYVAAVVRAEGGARGGDEYFKAQAVLCRTYAVRNDGRHAPEGFSLCDGVHCQAYHGRIMDGDAWYRAAEATRGLVVTGLDSLPVMAVFHACCGGETRSAEQAWISRASHLASINDPYCTGTKHSHWTTKIPLERWMSYLHDHGFTQLNFQEGIIFSQPHRLRYLRTGNGSMLLDQVRDDLGLRSSFFDVYCRGSEVVFKGRGYGHGVGLCQEGAMVMAGRGFTFDRIIRFYYRDVLILDMGNTKQMH